MATNIIKLNRGDSYEFKVRIHDKLDIDKNYILTDKDAVYFAFLCPHQRLEDAIFIKGYDFTDQDVSTGEILIRITPKDTKYLSTGVYYYTVKLQRGGSLTTINDCDEPEEVRTIIERTKFIINE